MRKILCLLLAFLLFTIPICSATDTSLKFDLNLSGTSPSDKSGNSLTVTPKNFSKSTETINGVSVPYFEFSGSTIANFYIADSSVLGLDNMTVEAWAKSQVDDTNGRILFSISSSKKDNATYYAEFTDENLVVNLGGQTISVPVKDTQDETKNFVDKWTHYAITRSFDAFSGKASIKVYINGVCLKAEELEATKGEETGLKLFFGAPGNMNNQKDYSFKGGISEARVYDKAFNLDEAKAKYNETCTTYGLSQIQTYSISSETYTVDNDALTITGVAPGTTKTNFLANVSISGDYVIEDTLANDILKDNTLITLGNGTVYTVKLNFENVSLINVLKYEFITDENVSEIAYDTSSGVKVTFNAEEFTGVDGTSFNNVSIYETLNPENTVSIANGSFANNAYTSDITGELEAGKNYTLKLTNIKDSVFEKEYTFTKTFDVISFPEPEEPDNPGGTTPDPEEPDNPGEDNPDTPITPADPDLLLDIDFSNFDGTAESLRDKAGNVSLITVNGSVDPQTHTGLENKTFKYGEVTKNTKDLLQILPENATKSLTKNNETSVEMWVKIDGWKSNYADYFMVKEPSSTAFKGESTYWAVEQAKSTKILYAGAFNSSNADNTVTDFSNWNHYVFTRKVYEDENENLKFSLEIYYNGELLKRIDNKQLNTTLDSDTAVMYFGNAVKANSMTGGMTGIKVYKKILTADEIKAEYISQGVAMGLFEQPTIPEEPENPGGGTEPEPDTPGGGGTEPDTPGGGEDEPDTTVTPPDITITNNLLADIDFSKFDGTAGSIKDKVGNVSVTLNGTLEAKVFKGTSGEEIKYAEFDKNTTDYISMFPENVKVPITKNQQTSVELWLRIDEWQGSYADYFMLKEPSSTKFKDAKTYWAVEQAKSTKILYAGAFNSGSVSDTLSSFSDWNHYVFTRKVYEDGEGNKKFSLEIYRNGMLLKSVDNQAVNTTLDSDTAAMYFGNPVKANSITGGIASIRIYNKILTGAEIKRSYDENLEFYKKPVFNFNEEEINKDASTIEIIPGASFTASDMMSKSLKLTINDSIISVKSIALDGDKISINLSQYLDYGQKIKVWSEAINDYNHFIVPKGDIEVSATLLNESGAEIEKPDGSNTLTVSLKIKNSGLTSENLEYAVVAKDSRNAAVSSKTALVTANVGENNVSIPQLTGVSNVSKVYVYVFKAGDTTLTPVYATPLIFE